MATVQVLDKQTYQTNEFEVVVAHFNEDLSWLIPIASATTLYVKGKSYEGCLQNSPPPHNFDLGGVRRY